MNIVENIKAFLKEQGLNWTGYIYKNKKEKFVEVTNEEFEKLTLKTFVIDFGEDGAIGLRIAVDALNFEIKGVDPTCQLIAYCGDNEKNVKACKDKNLSNEWIKFQLDTCGLVYATVLRKECEKMERRIEEAHDIKERQYNKKIELLKRRIEGNNQEREKELTEVSKLLKLANSYETDAEEVGIS